MTKLVAQIHCQTKHPRQKKFGSWERSSKPGELHHSSGLGHMQWASRPRNPLLAELTLSTFLLMGSLGLLLLSSPMSAPAYSEVHQQVHVQ